MSEQLEEVIDDLRELADQAETDMKDRKEAADMSDIDPSVMAYAERMGQMEAFQQAWKLAISKRDGQPRDSTDAGSGGDER